MKPNLRLEALRLDVETDVGSVGRTIVFRDGFNVIRADNTSGKSTALQAIIYALGLEGMLGPSQRIPLTHAMTDRVAVEGVDSIVRRSRVELEITNGAGRTITIRRGVVSPGQDSRLITVFDGPAISEPAAYPTKDYFSRVPGSARNRAGFHTFLAEFLGLTLPIVNRLDGGQGPLYLETIFPYFFVEQKHGWTGIQARIPTYHGIREVGKRSAEFVLGLDVFDRVIRRQRVASNVAQLESDWQIAARDLESMVRKSNLVLPRLPSKLSARFTPEDALPAAWHEGQWMPAEDHLALLQREFDEAMSSAVGTVGDTASGIEEELARMESQLDRVLAVASGLGQERVALQSELEQVELRLEALDEDLQRHLDSQRLQNWGSEHAASLLADHVCPTCHQELLDGADVTSHAMSTAENIEFIRRQIGTFRSSRDDIARVLEAVTARYSTVAANVRDRRTAIRAHKDALTAANASPSVAELTRRITLKQRIDELRGLEDDVQAGVARLVAIADDWRQQKEILKGLLRDDLTREDENRLSAVEESVRRQLDSYGFKSLPAAEIEIDRGTYRPIHEGFDLGFDLSASDMIRIIWSYLFAMMHVGIAEGGNHLGLLVFDEPKQQDTATSSYRALLHHAAGTSASGAQVIFATSETEESLSSMLRGTDFHLIALAPAEKLLRPLG